MGKTKVKRIQDMKQTWFVEGLVVLGNETMNKPSGFLASAKAAALHTLSMGRKGSSHLSYGC